MAAECMEPQNNKRKSIDTLNVYTKWNFKFLCSAEQIWIDAPFHTHYNVLKTICTCTHSHPLPLQPPHTHACEHMYTDKITGTKPTYQQPNINCHRKNNISKLFCWRTFIQHIIYENESCKKFNKTGQPV
jgi:hypothetical protein